MGRCWPSVDQTIPVQGIARPFARPGFSDRDRGHRLRRDDVLRLPLVLVVPFSMVWPGMGTSAVRPGVGTSPVPPGVGTSAVPPGVGTSVIRTGTGVLPQREAAIVGGNGGRRGRRHPIVTMAMPRGSGQIDGGPRADHDNGMAQAHDPVGDTGRGEKRRCHYGDPPGQNHPSGQALVHHHLHTYDLHLQSRSDRRPVLGVS